MIIGHRNLLDIFPAFQEDIKENGIDLRIGRVEQIQKDHKTIGCIDGEKYLPTYYDVKPINNSYYKFLPGNYYSILVDRKIFIPGGCTQFYFLRSTFSRCGLVLTDAVGDNGFKGTLRIGIYNAGPLPVYAGLNERIIQAVTIRNDGTASCYSGDYQEE